MAVRFSLSETLDGAVVMDIEVQPGAKVQGITGFNPWRSRVSVAVRAVAKAGQANRAVMHVLAAQLRLDPGTLSITNGHRSRLKSVRIEGLSVDQLATRLEPFGDDQP